ncbi:unnamed protein product, partial [Prorocentrum cordatum]
GSAAASPHPARRHGDAPRWERWPWHQVLAPWDPADQGYTAEYLSLKKDDWLMVCPDQEDGWAFAHSHRLGVQGWFPPTYIRAEPAAPS